MLEHKEDSPAHDAAPFFSNMLLVVTVIVVVVVRLAAF